MRFSTSAKGERLRFDGGRDGKGGNGEGDEVEEKEEKQNRRQKEVDGVCEDQNTSTSTKPHLPL